MVKVEIPAPVPEATLKVSLLVPLPGEAMLVGAKLAVTPFGSPLTDNVTADLNPFTTAVDSVIAAEPPGATLAFVALGVSVKVDATTVSVSGRVRVKPPPVPLIVTCVIARHRVCGRANRRLHRHCGGEDWGNESHGHAVRCTAGGQGYGELNPPCAAIVTVTAFEPPGPTDTVEELSESVNPEALASLQ